MGSACVSRCKIDDSDADRLVTGARFALAGEQRRWPAARRSHTVTRKRIAQLPGVLFVQVDLILTTVQPETDGTLGGAAIKVIDEQGLYLLGHSRSFPLTDLCRTSVDNPTPGQRAAAPIRSTLSAA